MKISDKRAILSTAYFPPIEYFAVMANSQQVYIQGGEMYQKQSYRTRCSINSANGVLVLTMPVLRSNSQADSPEVKSTHKVYIEDIHIDYSKPWVLQHKRAIEAAYMSSPFFEYYKDDIFPILESNIDSLFELNLKLIKVIAELIGIDCKITVAKEYLTEDKLNDITDYRETIHPKRENNILESMKLNKPYYQVFTNKQGFVKNLSILDLLFNEGPNSISYLESYTKGQE